MPIKELSELVRLPRLGKIRLGMKVEKEGSKSYPKALDYFNCPPEVQAKFGEKPTSLDIMFPSDDPELFAPQYLKCYSLTQGLICIGNGETARRKVDTETGAIASHTTKEWVWKENLFCDPQECPEYLSKQCRRVMSLLFLLPDVNGLGVWQIDTTSFYSIVNTNSIIKLLKNLTGRCSFIPLTLSLGPMEVSPSGQKKKKVHVMSYTQNQTLAEIASIGLRPAAQALLPEVTLEEPPDDLFPLGVIDDTFGGGGTEPTGKAAKEKQDELPPAEDLPEEGQFTEEELPELKPQPSKQPTKKKKEEQKVIEVDTSKIRNSSNFYSECHKHFKIQPNEALKLAGYSSQSDLFDCGESFMQVAGALGYTVVKP